MLDFSKSKQHDQWKRGLNVVVNTADLVRQVCFQQKESGCYSYSHSHCIAVEVLRFS